MLFVHLRLTCTICLLQTYAASGLSNIFYITFRYIVGCVTLNGKRAFLPASQVLVNKVSLCSLALERVIFLFAFTLALAK